MDFQWEIIVKHTAALVDNQGKITIAGPQINPGDTGFSSSRSVILHNTQLIPPIFSTIQASERYDRVCHQDTLSAWSTACSSIYFLATCL